MKILLFILSFCALDTLAQADLLLGQWKTIDDETDKERSIVEIYKKGDHYFGKIVKIFDPPPDNPDPLCDKCDEDDPRFNERVVGMEIIRNMEYDQEDGEYENGNILDPENGSVYDCKLWIENETLKVRGFLFFFYRTQTWYRHDS